MGIYHGGIYDPPTVPPTGDYAAITTDVLTTKVTGDAFNRFILNADGSTEAGDGTGATVLSSFTRTNSTAFGRNAGAADVSATPTYLTAFGVSTLQANTNGVNNSAFGVNSLQSNTTGGNSSAFGRSALQNNTTGPNNSAFGVNSLQNNTTGDSNSAFGVNSLQNNTTGGFSSAFGVSALLSNTTGGSSSAFGRSAIYAPGGNAANATTTAQRQTAIGMETGQASATQRDDIVCVGWRALVDGNNAIAIGSGVSAGAAGAVAIGKDSAGTSATTTTADEIKLGTALHTTNALGAMKVGKGFAAWGVAPPGAQPAAIASPTAPSAGYVQAEAASAKTAIDAIRAALTGAGITL